MRIRYEPRGKRLEVPDSSALASGLSPFVYEGGY